MSTTLALILLAGGLLPNPTLPPETDDNPVFKFSKPPVPVAAKRLDTLIIGLVLVVGLSAVLMHWKMGEGLRKKSKLQRMEHHFRIAHIMDTIRTIPIKTPDQWRIAKMELEHLQNKLGDLIGDYGLGKVLIALGNIQSLPMSDFPRLFGEAWSVTNTSTGGHGIVNLVTLRSLLDSYPKKVFDEELATLVQKKMFSLVAPDARYILDEVEEASVFKANGESFLFIAKTRINTLKLPERSPAERTRSRLTQLSSKFAAVEIANVPPPPPGPPNGFYPS